MATANFDIDKVKSLKSHLQAGIISIPELIKFLNGLESQLPEPKKKKEEEPIYHRGKLVRKQQF